MKDLLSTKQAEAITGVSAETIKYNCRKGFLRAQHVAGRWVIVRRDLDTWMQSGRIKPGPKSKRTA